jgi:hypothetical protein
MLKINKVASFLLGGVWFIFGQIGVILSSYKELCLPFSIVGLLLIGIATCVENKK